MGVSQNSVSFGKRFRKSGLRPAFSLKLKVAFPKTGVLGKPWISMNGTDVRAVLSQNIKNFRRLHSLSQADLSEKARISINFLSNIERGNKWPYPDTLANIAKALKVEVFELFQPEKAIDGAAKVKVDSLINAIAASVEKTIKKTYLRHLKQ
jgi:transcriptional regulator with XRE-family HTH domain